MNIYDNSNHSNTYTNVFLFLCHTPTGNTATKFIHNGPECRDLLTIAVTAHVFCALSVVRAIKHCAIGRECDLIGTHWLNW